MAWAAPRIWHTPDITRIPKLGVRELDDSHLPSGNFDGMSHAARLAFSLPVLNPHAGY